jgi:hypothetical protein
MSWRREPNVPPSSPINPRHPEDYLACRYAVAHVTVRRALGNADVEGDMQPLVAHGHQHAPATRVPHRGTPLTYPPGFGELPV